jgi:ribosome-binding factor A
MIEKRRKMIANVIQKELSFCLLQSARDPRIVDCTFTYVEISQDGKHAVISFNSESPKECHKGLMHAKGFFKSHLAHILNTRRVPELSFKLDKGLENSLTVESLLRTLEPDA